MNWKHWLAGLLFLAMSSVSQAFVISIDEGPDPSTPTVTLSGLGSVIATKISDGTSTTETLTGWEYEFDYGAPVGRAGTTQIIALVEGPQFQVSDFIKIFATIASVNVLNIKLEFYSDDETGHFPGLAGVGPFTCADPGTPGISIGGDDVNDCQEETGSFQPIYTNSAGNWSVEVRSPTEAPVPATLLLAAAGLAGVGFSRRRNAS